ncbi:keratin-associated protein 5-5-like [Mytilus californianus]|uniref:keratin-associated protein 5-5-like n=1 Tax=Mytilus californianus TaxID=6549 RepID=UPI002246E2F2|nr:keratin-associated protein 5-5-like [Mytilus californianus]
MANDEMMEEEELIHNLVKRSKPAPPCVNDEESCRYRKCCLVHVYGSCKACNPRKCKSTRDCCDESSCVYGNCRLVKRGLPLPPGLPSWCVNEGSNCWDFRCCPGSSCVDLICKSCNPRKCKNTRDCCDDSSCIYGNCKSCQERNCKRSNDCCKGYNCSYKKCVRSKKG